MAQLNQIIWSNITWGACGLFFMFLFGIAIKFEWNSQLTPKAWNRPRNVLKNVLKTHSIFGCLNLYPVTWFLWARKLTYPAAMEGIPGTGTRDDGWSGPTLKMNLDGVILLKFHRMLFKIALLATLLSCGVLLPTYTSSVCDPEIVTERECQRLSSLTDFENLTISHVPEVRRKDDAKKRRRRGKNSTVEEGFAPNDPGFTLLDNAQPQLIDEDGNIIIPSAPVAPTTNADTKWVPGISWRLMTTALCSAIIYAYTCYLLWHEWIDNLALRRVYFLESDHYPQRMQELDDIANLQTKPEDPIIAKRPPFVPHPEMREIPPNVSLYSVLYQLPVSLVTFDTDGETQMDRQLVATVNFFNECVPSQPGFSSSVVAATIIPDAVRVAKCWTLWYRLESKVRMVRYVRKIVRGKLQKLEDGTTDIYDDVAEALKNSNHAVNEFAKHAYQTVSKSAKAALKSASGNSVKSITTMSETIRTGNSSIELTSSVGDDDHQEQTPLVSKSTEEDDNNNLKGKGDNGESDDEGDFWQNMFSGMRKKDEASEADSQKSPVTFGDDDASNGDIEMQAYDVPLNDTSPNDDVLSAGSGGKFYGAQTHGFKYENYDVKQYAKTISHNEETELMDIVDGLGIEELSVFAREYAQSSSSPCPLGCCPNSLKVLEIDELRDIEEDLWADIKVLNRELIEAREYVVKHDDDHEVDSTMISTATSFEVASSFDNGGDGNDSTMERENDGSSSDVLLDSPMSRRSSDSQLRHRGAETVSHQWEKAQEVASSMKEIPEVVKRIGGGFFFSHCPSPRLLCGGRYNPCFKETLNSLPKYYGHMKGAGRAFVASFDHPSYAVVTFSSRQAAIAARQCLADGGANNSWQQIDEIPIPPLADAPPRKPCFCRGCCRPVTLTINYKEKKCRRWSVYVFMFFFCCFYTIPLAFISLVLNPRWLGQFFPNSKSLHDPNNILYRALAGPASGLATTLFMALLPQIFKLVAYYEGTSSSLEMAERKALLFMWYFMLVTAFFGQYLATMLIQWYYHAGVTTISTSLWSTVNTVATLIPSAIAPQWLNWIILRYGFIWPGGYFFQMNTFLFKITRMTCFNRVARGGGAGGPTPYRIYVDSGIVLLCVVGLSPMVPIVAPIALIYFIVVQPMLRWLLIFVYRPRYDTGGEKWPLCHQIVISSLIMAQVLTSVTLALKGSLAGAVFIGFCTFPTFMFSFMTEDRFLRPYKDTALLQTSRLDGGQESFSESEREEFRRWLVDCHKASYVPTCLLGSKENLLTVEPAVVIPKDAREVLSTNDGNMRRRKQKGGIYDHKKK